MINDVELLQDICESSEMGRDSIMHVIKLTDDPGFRKTLETQLTEFANMYDPADKMLQERGSRPSSVGPVAKAASYVTATMKTLKENTPSCIAEMMIQGSTMGITKLTRQLNEYDGSDDSAARLAQKQLKTEQANIDEMKKFL